MFKPLIDASIKDVYSIDSEVFTSFSAIYPDMSQPSPREIMDGFEAARARTFIYMAQAMIDELGEERGKQLIHDTIWKMSKDSGESARILYEKKVLRLHS